MAKHSGRLELTWADKDKTLLSTGDGHYDYTFVDPSDRRVAEVRLLEEVERVEAEAPADRGVELPAPTFDNLLVTGDAMHVLDSLAKIPEYADQYLGNVNLVYVDPPFNTGQAFTNYEDSIEHSIWLTMLRDRLRQIKPLLARDASVWVHLDDVEVHRCRAVMDEELGPGAYVTTVLWHKRNSRDNRAAFSDSQDYLLVYAPIGPQRWKTTRNLMPDLGEFANPDNDPNGPWRSVPMSAQAGRATASQFWTVTTPTGARHDPPKGRAWTYTEARFNELVAAGLIYWPRRGNGKPRLKRYPSPDDGLVPFTLWPSTEVGTTDSAKKEVMALFPETEAFDTPKPERLLERVIHIATRPGDIVLDCFAGSGTTAAVAHKMGRRWVTSELLPGNVDKFTKPRLAKIIHGEDLGGVTTATERVAVDELPDGVTPKDAQDFNRVLAKLAKTDDLELDPATLKALRDATRTREQATIRWFGGGGFRHVQVAPSMFEEVDGMVMLADWATNGDLARAMCAQLGVRHEPDGIFAGRHGRRRLAVIDGMVGAGTVDAIVDELLDQENVEVWATQVEDDAADRLSRARPASRLKRIPDAVLDTYRRRKASRSPFGGQPRQGDHA